MHRRNVIKTKSKEDDEDDDDYLHFLSIRKFFPFNLEDNDLIIMLHKVVKLSYHDKNWMK